MSDRCTEDDLVTHKSALLLWYIPGALLLIGVFWSEARVWVWTPALVVAGDSVRAERSPLRPAALLFHRATHLLGATATLLRGFGIVPVRWSWILYAVLGGSLLSFAPEWVGDKYVRPKSMYHQKRSSG